MSNENKQNDERAAFTEDEVEAAVKKATGEYRTGDSYTFEDVWSCVEVAWQARATQQATTGDERAEIERCAKICESVMEQSRNHLFRSAAKICAMSIRNPTQPCDRAPEGWMCSRIAGHEGPCAASQITKEWCVKMAAAEPEEGVPPAGLAALDDSATVIPVSPEELAKMFTPSPVAGSAGQAPVAVVLEDDGVKLLAFLNGSAKTLNEGDTLYTAPSLATGAGAVDQRHVGDSNFEGWYQEYATRLTGNPKQTARDAYAAGMGDTTEQRMSDAAPEEQPSWTNPMTPYGMLVRALRIVVGTTLMDMATFLGCSPAQLSALEFGRKPVTNADIVNAAHYFASFGINSTTHALTMAARNAEIERQGGE